MLQVFVRKFSILGPAIAPLLPLSVANATGSDRSPHEISSQQMMADQVLPDLYSLAPKTSVAPGAALDMTTAVHQAIAWHPSITQAVGKLFQQAANVDVAKSKYYPQISAGMNNSYSNTHNNSGYSPSFQLSISQMLYDFGKVSSSVRAADAAVAQQQAQVMLSIDQVAHDTAAAVVQIQGYQKLVEMATEQLASLQHIGGLIQQRYREGASSLSDVVQTETRIEGAQATLMQYQAALNRWKATLATYIGNNQVSQVVPAVPDSLSKACTIKDPDYRVIPSVLAAWAQANQAQAEMDYANANMLPTLSLKPQITHYLNNNYAGSRDLDKTQYTASINMDMPLYQGGGLSASKQAAAQALTAANAAIKSAQLEAQQKLTTSQDEALNLGQTLAVQQRQQQLAEKTRDLYQDQYLQLGTRPLLDLLNVDQEIYQAQFSQAQTQAQLNNLQLDCMFSTGMTRVAFHLENRTIQGVNIRP